MFLTRGLSVASIPMATTFMTEPQPGIGFVWRQPSAATGPVLECPALAEIAPHIFTSAHLTLREDPAEWSAVAEALGAQRPAIRLIRQVHGAAAAVIRRHDLSSWSMPEADIVATDDPSVVIVVRTADCAPILVADSKRGVVGAVHAGWRGAVQGAAVAGVDAMRREFGSKPSDLVVAIGPCLGVCCGEVGDEVVDAFRSAGHPDAEVDRWFSTGPGGRHHLHLARTNRDQLERAGVLATNVHVADLCTRSYPDVFHSYRAAGTGAGRLAAAIRLR
jgi:YfiH family protein